MRIHFYLRAPGNGGERCDSKVPVKTENKRRRSKRAWQKYHLGVKSAKLRGVTSLSLGPGRETVVNRILLAILAAMLFLTSAQAETWYLMTPNEPKGPVHSTEMTQMNQGLAIRPVQVHSRKAFSSRKDCETVRQKTVRDWRNRGLIKLAGSPAVGGPGWFIQCMSDADPRLKKSSPRAQAVGITATITSPINTAPSIGR
jgi:hypothetical protein